MKRLSTWWMVFACLTTAACDDAGGAPTSAQSAETATQAAASTQVDEKAAAPPGSLTVLAAQEAANTAPDTLSDKKVTVSGVVAKIGTQTAGKSSVTHYVKLTAATDEPLPAVYCGTGKAEPAGAEVGESVTVEGTGHLTKMKSKDGTTQNRLELRDCKIL